MSIHELVFEIIELCTGCITEELFFDSSATDEIASILKTEDLFNSKNFYYQLSKEELLKLDAYFDARNFSSVDFCFALRNRCKFDDLSYKSHTNRELILMLSGEKPLAVFYDFYPPTIDQEFIPKDKFEPHVINQRFIRREFILEDKLEPSRSMCWTLYALPEEAWRIEAFILMTKTAKISGWNNGFQRMEGSLLGYTDEQNNEFLNLMGS
jgi:hypothetical protein